MALTGLYSINGETSALEDKGLRDFISTASGSWTGGGGGSGPVTSTGGTTTYINKLNNMNLSASVAYASPNGAVLDNIYNSGRSGYAASAYLKNNVTGNVGNWNTVYTAYTANSAQWLRPAWTGYDYYNQGVNYITANNVGSVGFKFNPGNLFNSYTLNSWTYSECRIENNIYEVKFGANLNNVVGTQWSHHTGVCTLSKGNFIEVNTFNCGDGWNNTQIVLRHTATYSNSVESILRDVRNSSTADNNTITLYFTGIVVT